MTLPRPSCYLGYTKADLRRIFPDRDELAKFHDWMYGQTMGLCTGKQWNPDTEEYEKSPCPIPHGPAYYVGDVKRFLAGLPVID